MRITLNKDFYKGTDGSSLSDIRCNQIVLLHNMLKDVEEEYLTYKDIQNLAVEKGIYLELNANGIGNSKRVHPTEYMYPNKAFWKIVKKYDGAKIIIGCDAHNLDALSNENVTKAYEFAEELGLTILDKIEIKK